MLLILCTVHLYITGGTCVVEARAENTFTPQTLIVRSPLRAKHHVVVQYMAVGWKCPCPLPPNPLPLPQPPSPHLSPPLWPDPPCRQHDWWKTRRTMKN